MNSQVETTESIIVPEMANKNLIKKGLFVLLLGIVIYVILDYTVPGLGFVSDILTGFLEWVEENPSLGAIAFTAVYVFTTVCFIPGLILTLGSGLVFGRALGIGLGVLVGTVSVFIGATVGAIISFILGRFVFKDQAQKLFNKFKILNAVDRAIEAQGFKLVFLLRLSPVVPFSVFNYVISVTAVSFRDYILACMGMIPGTAAYVFIGTTASSLLGGDSEEEDSNDDMASMVQLIVIIVGTIATLIAVVLVSVYAKKTLNKVLKEESEEYKEESKEEEFV